MQITYTVPAFGLPQYWTEPDPESMPTLLNPDEVSAYKGEGWVEIGTATVTVEYLSNEQIAGQQLDALKAKLKTTLAKHEMEKNAILDQISKLSALTYVEAA